MSDVARLLELGRRVASVYVRGGAADAVVVAGSVGRGLSDAYSDLELDVYWSAPPDDRLRRAMVADAGGELDAFWDYAPDEGEWSETFRVDGCEIGVSGYTSAWVEQCLNRTVVEHDPWLLGQLRIAALLSGEPVQGVDLISAWRARALPYPRGLQIAVCTETLSAERLGSWHQRHALVARDDVVFLRALCAAPIDMVLHALCAVNSIYLPHPHPKWLDWLTRQLIDAPVDLAARLRTAADGPVTDAVTIIDALLEDTLDIVGRRLPEVDAAVLRRSLSEGRTPLT